MKVYLVWHSDGFDKGLEDVFLTQESAMDYLLSTHEKKRDFREVKLGEWEYCPISEKPQDPVLVEMASEIRYFVKIEVRTVRS